MSRKVKIVKKNPEPARGTVGVNPSDPWSAKANIAESSSLDTYLLSRGINPKFVSKDTKISHAKSSQFMKWKQDHKFEEVEQGDVKTLEEDALLDKYLSSRGINPKFATKMVKISYAKSSEFEKWKRDHMFESLEKHTPTEIRLHALKKAQHRNTEIRSNGIHAQLHKEETDKEDVLSFDIPLFIRILELAREDVKEDMELHRITERLLSIRKKGVLTMDDYEFIAGLKKIKEECQIDEAKTIQGTALDKFRKAALERENKHNEIEKKRQEKLHQDPSKVTIPEPKATDGMSAAIDRLEKHLNKEETELDEMDQKFIDSLNKLAHRHKEGDRVTVNSKFFGKQKGKVVKVDKQSVHVQRDGKSVPEKYPHDAVMKEETEQIDELKKSTVKSWLGQQDVVPPKKPGMDRKAHNQRIKTRSKSWDRALDRLSGHKPTSENTLDPLAATEAPCTCANDDTPTEKKRQLSKSARMIKALYKKHNMKEEMYDWEKDDKNQTSPGKKKPKLDKSSEESNFGSNKPQARAVMSGGKTMTGEKRDVVEIDPLLKNRPDLNGNTKDVTDKKKQ